MKIAILGSRGIPGNYGGFETCAEELATRLVKRGHEVRVYCSKPYSKDKAKKYKGVERVILPTVKIKSVEKVFNALLSLIHVSVRKVEVVLMLGVSAAPFCFIPRLVNERVAINIDGLEWKRKKWGRLIAWILRYSEKMAGITTNLVLTDAKWIKIYYKEKYGKDSIYIAYGADEIKHPAGEILKKYGLNPFEYVLYVSRFDPENNPLLVREAFDEIGNVAKKLVMVGDAPYARDYIAKVKNTKNPNIIFTGFQFGDAYKELQSNAFFYIQATEIGGTHPALIEAMGAGRCVLAKDVPEHREVLGECGIYFKDKEELKEKIKMLIADVEMIKEKGAKALNRVKEEYSWEKIVNEYERVFKTLLKKGNLFLG